MSIREQLNIADSLIQRGMYIQALDIYEEILKTDPNNTIALLQSAQIYHDVLKDYPKTEQRIMRFLEFEENADAYVLLADALDDQGQFKRALPYYQSALKLAPQDQHIQYNFGVYLLNQAIAQESISGIKEAIDEISKAEGLNKTRDHKSIDHQVYLALGNAYWNWADLMCAGDDETEIIQAGEYYHKAQDYYSLSLEKSPNYTIAKIRLYKLNYLHFNEIRKKTLLEALVFHIGGLVIDFYFPPKPELKPQLERRVKRAILHGRGKRFHSAFTGGTIGIIVAALFGISVLIFASSVGRDPVQDFGATILNGWVFGILFGFLIGPAQWAVFVPGFLRAIGHKAIGTEKLDQVGKPKDTGLTRTLIPAKRFYVPQIAGGVMVICAIGVLLLKDFDEPILRVLLTIKNWNLILTSMTQNGTADLLGRTLGMFTFGIWVGAILGRLFPSLEVEA